MGTTTDYRLAAKWDLTTAEYRLAELLHKTAGVPNRLSFNARLRDSATQIEELHFEAPQLNVVASATYQYAGKEPLSLTVTTNQFPAGTATRLLPRLTPYQPDGKLQVEISGKGDPNQADGMRWEGAASLAGCSFRPPGQGNPLSEIDGTIRLRGTTLETEQVTGRIGSSFFSVRGRMVGFSSPSVELSLSSPALRLQDVGTGPDREALVVQNLSANISLKERTLTIGSLSGKIKDSSFSIQGAIPDIGKPDLTLRVDFPFLKAEDMAFLSGLRRKDTDPGHPPPIALQARVSAASGTVGETHFSRLAAEFSLDNSRLVLPALNVGILGGTLAGSGQVAFTAAGGPVYEARYRLDRLDAARLLGAAGVREYLDGLLSGEGELTARGGNRDELKKSACGSANIEVREGTVRTYGAAGQEAVASFPFSSLQAGFSFERNGITLRSIKIDTYGGVISGSGEAAFRSDTVGAYAVRWQLGQIDAAAFFRAGRVTKEISGLLSSQGNLTATGDSLATLKKTAQGSIELHLAQGTINKFQILSGVFSILNVSQLLEFRLPDMVLTGLPYDTIDGTFSLAGGSAATSDLVLKSPSLNISLVGKADLVNEEFDLKVGVQPLQSVGKVVSRIPVAGWILTGGDRQLIVTYFEATGKWDNPKVSAIPVQTLPKGVFNIFKRTFQLPEKLITDTGEVIMGKIYADNSQSIGNTPLVRLTSALPAPALNRCMDNLLDNGIVPLLLLPTERSNGECDETTAQPSF